MQGHPIMAELPKRAIDHPGRGVAPALREELARRLGLEVSRLFYDWQQPAPGESLVPMGI